MFPARPIARVVMALTLLASLLAAGSSPAAAVPGSTSVVFINEFHYDNAGADVDEFVEVAAPAGTDLSGWQIVPYNGNGGTQYSVTALSGTAGDQSGGYGFVTVAIAGLQNGAPDGIALVDADGAVVQFLSYEGSFAAVDGPAAGLTSTDVGVSEPGDTAVGASLQLIGSGTTAADFTWTGPATATSGGVNTDQSFGGVSAPARVVINEIDYDQPSSDTAEYIELYNAGGTAADLGGWTVQLVNGSNGETYATVALSGELAPGAYFVICTDAATVASCDDAGSISSIQNGDPDAVLLSDGAGDVVDAVSYEGTVAGAAEGEGGAPADPSNANRSISRLPDGVDTDDNAADFTVACVTPGEANVAADDNCGEALEVKIHEVQGSTDTSPLVGQTVTVEGIVVGDYEGPSPTLRGFYVQEEDDDVDDDPATSEAVFVFNVSNDSVSVGDQVRVTATVEERFGQTQLGFPSELDVLSSGNSATPTAISLPLESEDSLEAVEGMLVTLAQTVYVTEFFQLGRFGQIVVSADQRLDQPTAVVEPGPESIALQAANDLNRLIIDDTLNEQNPDPIILARNGEPLSATNTLRGGDTLTGATGVITYTWAGNAASGNAYRLRPVDDSATFDFTAANPRPTEVPDVAGSVQVAAFNVLNYYLTIDTGANVCGGDANQGCRGADSNLELERQRAKLLTALTKLDVDVIGLVEVENTPGVDPEGDLAAGLTAAGEGSWVAVDAAAVGGGVVGSDAIRVGMIYDADVVAPVGAPALLDFSLDSLGEPRSRTAVAQTFVELDSGEVFTAVVNHFKSKGGSEIADGVCVTAAGADNPDCDRGDGSGFFNATRTAHAAELVAWLDGDPTGSGDADVLILGDLNAYAKEDPIDVLVDAGYVDLLAGDGVTDGAYSFVFDGQWGYLDYVLASPSLVPQVTGADHYHINADEPSVLDYNTNFKSDSQIENLYAPDEFRTSDHDPGLVGLDLSAATDAGFVASADPDTLWPPNHKYRTVTVDGATGLASVIAATSSEADSGLGADDVPDDINLDTGSADTVELRAERFSTDGRVYTLEVRISNGAQTLFTTTEVTVEADQRGGRSNTRP